MSSRWVYMGMYFASSDACFAQPGKKSFPSPSCAWASVGHGTVVPISMGYMEGHFV